ncbi:Uncharacterised protein [uncultured archaeon]|nr:Uncharacterised protein [uncultured archaeon]
MADFLSRLVERTFGLIQVAEPVITPSFAAASIMENMEGSVFEPGLHQGVSQLGAPRGITQIVAHPGYGAGIKERGTIAGSSPFEVKPAGLQVISGHEQSGFDLTPGTMSENVGFGRDMTDVTQQLPEDATWKNEKTVYHPQPRPMISETPVKDENSPESRRAEIMAAEKKSLYQLGRSLNITGTPDDEVPGNLKNAYTENMKTLKNTPGVFHVQPERISHEPQTDRADPGNLQKPGDKYQRIETGNQSEFQVAASGEIPEMINLTDSAEKKSAKQGHVYHNVTKPGNELQIQDPGTLILRRKETGVPDKKMFQTYHTSESYISTQKRREIQGSLVSTTIAETPVSRRKLYQNASASSSRNPPEKHIAESYSTNPVIKVTIGHVEVRAATKPAQVSVPSRQNPVLSLNDYLKKRNGNTL